MKIAVISDIHENAHNLILFLQKIENLNIEKILFLGDFINNGIAKILASAPVPVYAIWWNNDGDKVAITKTTFMEGSKLEVAFDSFDIVEVDGRTIFLTHFPILARPMAKSGDFDAVFYGHDHKYSTDLIGKCIVANPGEISAHKTWDATFAIYDTQENTITIEHINESISLKTGLGDNYKSDKWIISGIAKSYTY